MFDSALSGGAGQVLILPDKKIAFVHVPKTGGCSILAALEPCGGYKLGNRVRDPRGHITAQQAKALLPEWDDYFSFAFVRELEGYARSFYKFVDWQGSFDDFLLNGGLPDQRSFICDSQGKQLVTYVGHYEQLAEEYQMIAERFNLPLTLPWLGKSYVH